MDEDDHRRADEEMKILHLHHCHQRNRTQKFVHRMTSMLYKALLLAVALGFLCLLPSHFTAFAKYSCPALLARSWDAVSILLVCFVISFGFLGRGQPDVQEIDRSENAFNLNSFFESNGSFGDSAPKSIGSIDSALESNGCEDFPQKSDGFEAVSDSEYQRSHKSEVNHAVSLFSTVIAEVTEGLENTQSLSTFDGSRRPPPPPQPPTNPPPQNDSNMVPPIMRYRSLKRKRKTVYHSVPPPPPSACPAVETLFPKQKSKGAYGHENSENPPKIDKKLDNKNPSSLPPRRPQRPNEDGVTVNHLSRHRRSRNKEDSQHRTKEDEHKHKSGKNAHNYNSAEDIDNAPDLPDRKHKKIPYQPTPPLSSTLQQWWSSYKKESKHKSKDSDPSHRRHSDKSSRNVHSSASTPHAPPPLPPLPSTFIVDRISKHHRKVHSSTSSPPPPPLPPTSTVERVSKHHRKVHSSTTAAPAPSPPTLIVERISTHLRNEGIAECNGWSKSRRDETSESEDSSNSSKENMVRDGKAEEKLASWKSLPTAFPPPPPLPPFPMFQYQQPLSNDTKREKRKSSTVESAKSKPEPEHGRAFAFRKQFSLDNVNPQFCQSPSPDEVNRKADAFIAMFREQIRLQK